MSDEPTVEQIAEVAYEGYEVGFWEGDNTEPGLWREYTSVAGRRGFEKTAEAIMARFIRPLQQRAERAERHLAESATTIEMMAGDIAAAQQARAEAEALVISHEGRIATLEAELATAKGEEAAAIAADEACAIAAQNTIDDLTRKLDAAQQALAVAERERDKYKNDIRLAIASELRADLAARDRLVEALRGVLKQIADATYSTHTHTGLTLIARSALALTPASMVAEVAEVAGERAVVEAAVKYRDVMPPHTQYPEPAWLRTRRLFIEAVDALATLRADRKER